MSNAKVRLTPKSRLWTTASNAKSNPKLILRHAQDDGLDLLKNKIMVRPRRELSRTLVEPLILDFDIHLAFVCLPQARILTLNFIYSLQFLGTSAKEALRSNSLN